MAAYQLFHLGQDVTHFASATHFNQNLQDGPPERLFRGAYAALQAAEITPGFFLSFIFISFGAMTAR